METMWTWDGIPGQEGAGGHLPTQQIITNTSKSHIPLCLHTRLTPRIYLDGEAGRGYLRDEKIFILGRQTLPEMTV